MRTVFSIFFFLPRHFIHGNTDWIARKRWGRHKKKAENFKRNKKRKRSGDGFGTEKKMVRRSQGHREGTRRSSSPAHLHALICMRSFACAADVLRKATRKPGRQGRPLRNVGPSVAARCPFGGRDPSRLPPRLPRVDFAEKVKLRVRSDDQTARGAFRKWRPVEIFVSLPYRRIDKREKRNKKERKKEREWPRPRGGSLEEEEEEEEEDEEEEEEMGRSLGRNTKSRPWRAG